MKLIYTSYKLFYNLHYTQTSTNPLKYRWNGYTWQFIDNEIYLRNGKVSGGHEIAQTTSGGNNAVTLT